MILQPAARCIERIPDRDMQILMRVVFTRLTIDHDFSARNRKIHADMVDIALPMMPMPRLKGDPAGADPIGELLQFLHLLPHLRFG